MNSSQSDLDIVHMFDSYIKKTLRLNARLSYKRKRAKLEREVYFSDLSQRDLLSLSVCDRYFEKDCFFSSLDSGDCRNSIDLGEALRTLSQRKQEVVILSIGYGYKDIEVARVLNLTPDNARFHRTSAIKKLKEYFGVLPNE